MSTDFDQDTVNAVEELLGSFSGNTQADLEKHLSDMDKKKTDRIRRLYQMQDNLLQQNADLQSRLKKAKVERREERARLASIEQRLMGGGKNSSSASFFCPDIEGDGVFVGPLSQYVAENLMEDEDREHLSQWRTGKKQKKQKEEKEDDDDDEEEDDDECFKVDKWVMDRLGKRDGDIDVSVLREVHLELKRELSRHTSNNNNNNNTAKPTSSSSSSISSMKILSSSHLLNELDNKDNSW